MRKLWIILYCSMIMVIFLGCVQVAPTEETSFLGSMPSNDNQSKIFVLSNVEDCLIEETTIRLNVANETVSYSFVDFFKISDDYRWELYWDKSCLPSLNIRSKTVDLEEGENYLYALFVNKQNEEDIYLYEIIVYRNDDFEIFYMEDNPNCYIKIYPNNVLVIYDDAEVFNFGEKNIKLNYRYVPANSEGYSFPVYEIDVTKVNSSPGTISSYSYLIILQNNIIMYQGIRFFK